jgi:hypothetical protein
MTAKSSHLTFFDRIGTEFSVALLPLRKGSINYSLKLNQYSHG